MTGSNSSNRQLVEDYLDIRVTLNDKDEEILYDPQTSGGLLLSLPSTQADDLLRELSAAGIPYAAKVGDVVAGKPGIMLI